MKAAALVVPAFALLATACATQYDTDYPMGLPESTTTCPEDPPQACTMDYRPAFGYDEKGGILGEYGNACGACATDGVKYTSPKQLPKPAAAPDDK